jgi:hypothetical protein
MRSRSRSRAFARDLGTVMLVLAAVFACACGASGAGDPSATEEETPPSGNQGTAQPTSTRPEFNPDFPDGGAPTGPDGGTTPDAAVTCVDPNDTGGSENTAKALTSIDDCDVNGSTINGVVNGAVDVDFYKFDGSDTTGCSVNPTLSTTSVGVELCMFASCLNGNIDFKSCTGGTQTALGPKVGCCITATTTAEVSTTLKYNCLDTLSESASIFIRARQVGGAACLTYSAKYHF